MEDQVVGSGECLEGNVDTPNDCPSLFRLTHSQKERMEKNKLKAKALKHARLVDRHHGPSSKIAKTEGPVGTQVSSAGGYMIDTEDGGERLSDKYKLVEEEGPPLPGEEDICQDCVKTFAGSFLKSKFSLNVCDGCRDKHKLIAKTEAKQLYCLKDGDFEERYGSPLPFIMRRNPHHPHGGSMTLYLEEQVESRAHSIWGGEEGLLAEQQRKTGNREKMKQRKYEKKITELRKAVRASSKVSAGQSLTHEHTFPPENESYDEDSDTWTKTCSECGYQINYEKM